MQSSHTCHGQRLRDWRNGHRGGRARGGGADGGHDGRLGGGRVRAAAGGRRGGDRDAHGDCDGDAAKVTRAHQRDLDGLEHRVAVVCTARNG